MQLANISIMSFPTSCSTHFQSLPHSRASKNCFFFIQYLSLAYMTNLQLVLAFSMGMATISLWSWPGNMKCAPTGFTVSLWHGWVTVPKCSLNLFLKGLSLQPMYCGPFTCAHWPDPLSQLTEYTTHGVRHDRLELIWNFSPVELQV